MRKFILITLGIILVGLFAFHFIAANQAESQIDMTIQAHADSSAIPFSVQYSNIDLSPFKGNLEFSHVTIIERSNIERAENIFIDLSYLDFLKIYFSGAEQGLQNISATDVKLKKISYVNRKTMQEVSLASADLRYNGNLWDGIKKVYLQQPAGYRHQLDIMGQNLHYTKPNSVFGTFRSDSASAHFSFPQQGEAAAYANNSLELQNIIWSPPTRVQKKYGFFIQGFGYPLDALPISKLGFSFTPSVNRIQISEGITRTELFTVEFEGSIVKDSIWAQAQLAPLQISLVDLSSEFKNVLSNIENLLGVSIPQANNKLTFQLVGPVQNPRIKQNN